MLLGQYNLYTRKILLKLLVYFNTENKDKKNVYSFNIEYLKFIKRVSVS